MRETDFPILLRKINGNRLVYLDNAATTQKPNAVIDAMGKYYTTNNANVSRGVHTLGEESTKLYEDGRAMIADFLGVKPRQVVFTSGATDSLNMASAWACAHLKEGDEILLTILEHHANLVVWQRVASMTGAKLVYVGLNDAFEVNQEDFAQKLSKKTKLVCLAHASNVLGTVLPIKEMCAAAHETGARVVIDGAQAVGHIPVNILELDCDFYAFSAHKMLGPQGIGCLIIAESVIEEMPVCRVGGGMILSVTKEESTWADIPYRFEAGTPNVAGVVGLCAAIKYIQQIGLDTIHNHELELTAYAWAQLSKIEDVQLYGPLPDAESRAAIIAFDVRGVHAHDVAQVLDDHGVAIRSGMHCTMPLHESLGIEALNRVSFALYNSQTDVDTLVSGIQDTIALFGDKNV